MDFRDNFSHGIFSNRYAVRVTALTNLTSRLLKSAFLGTANVDDIAATIQTSNDMLLNLMFNVLVTNNETIIIPA